MWVVKGCFCLALGAVVLALIITLAVLSIPDIDWCNADLNAGECEKYELDDRCFCIDMINRNKTTTQLIGVYEQAESQCHLLDGLLATPEKDELLIWLAKKMFSMGVDNAFVGLKKVGPMWFWMKADGAQEAATIPWRNDFPGNPDHKHAMINVETLQKEDQDEYYGYINYNYNHYVENDRSYQWFGFTTSDNIADNEKNDYEKSYLVCEYASDPQIEAKAEVTTQQSKADQKPANPCYCSSSEPINLNNLEDSATFTSPKYPQNYCSDLNCRWIVKAGKGLTVNLDWLVFSIEKNMDYVYIYDGESDDSPLIDKCTSSSCMDRKSSSHLLQVHFHSDHVTTDLGFKARVTAIDPDPCYCSEHSKISLTNLGESYTLASPNYPADYCSTHDCKWSVSAPPGLGLRVMWHTFNLRDSDSVLVYNTTSDETQFLQECKSKECKGVVSYYEGIYIEFVAEGQDVFPGKSFSAVLTVVENFCAEHQEQLLGSISYSARMENGTIPVGTIATLVCHPESLTKGSAVKSDRVICDGPSWNTTLAECTKVCNVEVVPITDFRNPIHLCHYHGQLFDGIKTGPIFEKGFVADGQGVILNKYINNVKAAEAVVCEDGTWTPNELVCHTIGILMIGGQESTWKEANSRSFEYASLLSNETMLIPDYIQLSQPRTSHVSMTLGNGQVLVAGGSTGSKTELYDLSTGSVTEGPPMLESRSAAAAARFNGEVWVCGPSRSCEKLTKAMEWIKTKDMHKDRSGLGLAAIEGDGIYAIGGLLPVPEYDWWATTEYADKTVEKYTIESDSWTYVAEMNVERSAVTVAQLDGFLYACGGSGTGQMVWEVDSCERYEPERDAWQFIASMMVTRESFLLVPLYGKLYAIRETMDEYDPKTNTWKKSMDLLKPKFFASYAIVPYYDDNG